MSHFKMAVIVPNQNTPSTRLELGKILQPWHEFECTVKDDEYVCDVNITADALLDYERHKEEYSSFEKFLEEWYGISYDASEGMDTSEDAGKYGYFVKSGDDSYKVFRRTNPNAKWDWWTIGGRYAEYLITKDGLEVDICQVKDLDAQRMKDRNNGWRKDSVNEILNKGNITMEELQEGLTEYQKYSVEWKDLPEPRPRGKEFHEWLKTKSDIAAKYSQADIWNDLTDIKEPVSEWVQNAPFFSCWGFVKDGQWYEKGEMGWFGMSSGDKDDWEETTSKMISELDPNDWIAIVDCHI